MGRIADQTRSILPISWDALSSDDRVGDSALLSRINSVTARVIGEVDLTDTQQDELDPILVEFIAKKSAIQIIDTAIDFWMDREITITTTGTSEVISYPDRIAALKEQKKNLIAEVAEMADEIVDLVPTKRNRSAPLLSSIDDELITPRPQDLGRIYQAG